MAQRKAGDLFPKQGHFVKRPIPIRAVTVTEPVVIQSLEGEESGKPGDMLITGVKGEQYFMSKETFNATYAPTQEEFMYVKRPIIIYAETSETEQQFELPWGSLTARAGDYVITAPGGSRYPVNAEIFRLTYEPVEENRQV